MRPKIWLRQAVAIGALSSRNFGYFVDRRLKLAVESLLLVIRLSRGTDSNKFDRYDKHV
jgi:hypothetical protein